MLIENRKKEACSRGTSSLGTATVNRPSKHSDGRFVYKRVVAFGLLLFVFGCEGTWLDCFLRDYTKHLHTAATLSSAGTIMVYQQVGTQKTKHSLFNFQKVGRIP